MYILVVSNMLKLTHPPPCHGSPPSPWVINHGQTFDSLPVTCYLPHSTATLWGRLHFFNTFVDTFKYRWPEVSVRQSTLKKGRVLGRLPFFKYRWPSLLLSAHLCKQERYAVNYVLLPYMYRYVGMYMYCKYLCKKKGHQPRFFRADGRKLFYIIYKYFGSCFKNFPNFIIFVLTSGFPDTGESFKNQNNSMKIR